MHFLDISGEISFILAYSFFLMFLFLYLSNLEFYRLSRLWGTSNIEDTAISAQISLAAITTKNKWSEKCLCCVIWGLGSKENCQFYLSKRLHEQVSQMTIFHMTSELFQRLTCQYTCHIKNCHMSSNLPHLHEQNKIVN